VDYLRIVNVVFDRFLIQNKGQEEEDIILAEEIQAEKLMAKLWWIQISMTRNEIEGLCRGCTSVTFLLE